MVTPAPLVKGDRIAIISPATVVREEYVDGAARFLDSQGFRPVVMPSAKGPACGTYAASDKARIEDLLAALEDQEIKAILCARGGYGCVHLVHQVPVGTVRRNPKWIIGFSDVSALHAMFCRAGVVSLHAPMARHLTEMPADNPITRRLLSVLGGCRCFSDTVDTHPLSLCGKAEGRLCGGNLAVLNGLASTSFDMLRIADGEDVILFFEDIAEPIYKIERVLTRLWLSGTLGRARGIVFGQFTEYRPDANFDLVEEMAVCRLKEWGIIGIPVAVGFPVGHVCDNRVMVEGSRAVLEVGDRVTTLTQTL